MKQIIFGTCPSKSNCYRVANNIFYKTDSLKKFEDNFYIQCNHYRNSNVSGYFEFYIDVFYPNQRADLDNSLKVVLDCLQKCKAFPNDNKCVKIVARKFLDKTKPRIEFLIKQI
jgi:Holliday junction resolvase RusA-like endonuclease